MIIKDLKECPEITAGDGSALRELLNPNKSPLPLGYSLAYARVRAGRGTRPHRLKSSEVYFILEGRGVMHVGEETARVVAGQAVYIPPFHVQFIENIGQTDLAFLCIVDPAWRPEDEEIVADGPDGQVPHPDHKK
jgi:mannose-6-phosphate isomerase-like protein (cupin superfamily)